MPKAVYLETFGCQMNELDSELVAGALRSLGYRFTRDANAAEVVLYNTCSVREHAEQKVWSRLGELAIRKKTEPSLVVGVLGCMAERDGMDLIRRMPVVDVLCGPGELDKLPALLDNAVRTRLSLAEDETADGAAAEVAEGKPKRPLVSARQVALQGNASRRSATLAAAGDSLEMLDLSRAVSPVDPEDLVSDDSAGDAGRRRASAYVRITRGCNKFCTYCVVPFTRGAEVHRPPDHIVDECKRVAEAGVVEVTLLGQTVNHYRFEHGAAVTLRGIVQPQKGRAWNGAAGSGDASANGLSANRTTTFAGLLARIHDEVPTIQRLRFVTSYPRDFGDDVLEVIRDHPRICRYLHVPGQSGSNRILKAMNRGYTVEEYEEFLARARSFLDEPERGRPLMVSGDFIVGFPGETEDDFDTTVALLRRARYKNSFIFKYSPRPGTTAFDRLADDVPEETKRRRNNALLAVQTEISDEISREQVGRTFNVLVEGLSRKAQSPRSLPRPAAGGVALTVNGRNHGEHGGSACAIDLEAEPAAELSDSSQSATTASDLIQLSARTDGDQIVFFEVSATEARSLVGSIVPVRIDRADRLSLHGTRIGA